MIFDDSFVVGSLRLVELPEKSVQLLCRDPCSLEENGFELGFDSDMKSKCPGST